MGNVRRLYHQTSYDSTVPVRRPAGSRKNRTIKGIFMNFRQSLNTSANARPWTGRCFMSRSATGEKRHVCCRNTYCIYLDISILKTDNIYTKIYISLEQLRINKCSEQVLLKFLQVWFSPPSLSLSISVFFISTTCIFGGIMANFDINVYIITREKLVLPCKIGRAQYTVPGWPLTTPVIGRCCQRTICDNEREIARAIQIRRWFANRWNRTASTYVWP